MAYNFTHRSNRDGTLEATCVHCFETIANVRDEAELPRFEREHTCDPFIVARFEFWKKAEEAMEN